jgi:hypothetical protein|tara:strand:- start:5280 stop:7172 length:1893 start_codon:yes stop_codon:yes gene_type:complete
MATVDDLVVKIRADTKDISRGVTDVNRQLGRLNTAGARSFQQMGRSVATTTAKVTALVGAIGSVTAVTGIAKVGMAFEDLGDSLNRVFGGQAGGQQAMAQITKFAQTTPFDIETVTKAFIGLKSAGIQPSMKMLQTFADTASVSTDQLGTFETLVRVTQRSAGGGLGLEELNQISDRGIDIFSGLSEKLGKSREELSELGKTAEGAKLILNALQKDLEGKFGGAMADKMDNLSTKVSNMGISFKDAANEIFKSGLDDMLKDTADNLSLVARRFAAARRVARGDASFAELDVAFEEQRHLVGRMQATHPLMRGGGFNKSVLKEIEELSRIAAAREKALRIEAGTLLSGKALERFDANRGIVRETGTDDTPTELSQEQIEARALMGRLIQAAETDQQKIKRQMQQLNELNALATGDGSVIDPKSLDAAKEHLRELQKELDATANVMTTELKQAIESNINSFTNDFVRGLLDGQNALGNFTNFAKSMVSQIIASFIRLKVIEPFITALFSGGMSFGLPSFGGGGGGGGVGLPAVAGGGRVGMGVPTLVGERGPEIFVPNQHGRIMNNADSRSAMGGSGVVINQSINFSTGIVPTVRAEVSKMMPQIADVTRSAVMESAQRGGQFRKGLAGVNG